MIHIDYDHFTPPPEWLERARRAKEGLEAIQDSAARKDYINGKLDIWSDLKPRLSELSHGKCWYCEAKEDRSDYNVDHFRPKNRVRHDDGSECGGYYWLAFEWSNFRLACDYCNSLHTTEGGETCGKSDFFPLHEEGRRARRPQDNLSDEMPLLLDPTMEGDAELLWFMSDGFPYPAADKDTFPCERAEATIRILNLKDVRVVEARKALWQRCQRLVDRGENAYVQYRRGSPAGMREYQQVCREIHELISPKAEYSAVARAYFKSSTLKWVQALV